MSRPPPRVQQWELEREWILYENEVRRNVEGHEVLNNSRESPARRAVSAAALVLVMLTSAGCTTPNPLADQERAGENKNYIAGDGSVTEYAPEQRKEPLTFTGTDIDGNKQDAVELRGRPLVLNFWSTSCGPCRKEAPDLEAINQEFSPQGLVLLGINLGRNDTEATIRAFIRNFSLTYPMVLDQSGAIVQSVSTYVSAQAVPTTIVVDRQGRVAARIIGTINKGTLDSLINSVIEPPTPRGDPPQ